MRKLPELTLGSKKQPLLTIAMLGLGYLTVFLLIGGLFSDYWIETRELAYHRDFPDSTLQAWVRLHAGLFKACPYEVQHIWIHRNKWKKNNDDGVTDTPAPTETHTVKNGSIKINECAKIPYVNFEFIAPPPNVNSAVLESIRKTTSLVFAGMFFMIIGCAMATFGLTDGVTSSRRHWIFIAGLIFIISGLLMMISLIVFCSCINHAVDENSPRSGEEVFSYYFSASFGVISLAFPLSEMSGVSAMYLYIHHATNTVKDEQMRTRASESMRSSKTNSPDGTQFTIIHGSPYMRGRVYDDRTADVVEM
ncbi:voltage-dependent calcium channel gamma-5 subunit-like [Antedon mediterranea]|uniref:voltage-dependent calcium channel gamma-5 subunit-like n=1 Tax=Antedon mediterranea TaxID=105859 RepID=UPI003AF86071